mmetsp:Transcript_14759/g.57905  ORF Transcript_14759/g.57905 Transcript_14759/m.57905 type:complete len:246 (-) Transcript_14759:155-892(-)
MHTAHVSPVPLSTTSVSSSPSSPAVAAPPQESPRRKLSTRSRLENTAVLATAATSSALSRRVSGGLAAAVAARCASSLRFSATTTESRTHRAPKVTHALVAAFGQSSNGESGDSRVTTTVLPCFGSFSKVSSASPDSLETNTDGTFTSSSSTFFAMGISGPSTLSKTTTATAPAISAFLTLVTKSHFSVPKERCTRAIHRPSYLFVRASHASFGDASSSRAVKPSAGTRGPNTAGSSFTTGRYPA